MERKTPLYQTHVDAGGKIVEFGGFLMPVQYPTGVLAEHMAVRQKAGLFDVSHMGELRLKGPDAVANVQKLITADISTFSGKISAIHLKSVPDDLPVFFFFAAAKTASTSIIM